MSSPTSFSSSITQWVMLALLSALLASYAKARSLDDSHIINPGDTGVHMDSKRFYVPVIISSDAILASLRDRQAAASSSDINGLERKRTAAARLEYLDSLFPRSVEPKRQMFMSPLGYMSASARVQKQRTHGNSGSTSREDAGSAGFRYG